MPDAPVSLLNDPTVTDAARIRFTWTQAAEDGGTPVLDYAVYYDNGRGDSVYDLLDSAVVNEYYLTVVTLVADVNYSFKVSARNAVGSGDLSDAILIKAAEVADAPLALVNVPEITLAYQIGLSWSPGSYNGGSPVLDYRVSYKQEASPSYTVY